MRPYAKKASPPSLAYFFNAKSPNTSVKDKSPMEYKLIIY